MKFFEWLKNLFKKPQVPNDFPIVIPPEIPESKEDYYNNKYPKEDILYKGRTIPKTTGNVNIDVRDFINKYDSQIQAIAKTITGTDDAKAFLALKWVIQNIKYTSDQSNSGVLEYWQFPFETIKLKKGDCEDGAILLANILTACNIPYWKIRLSAGWVEYAGSTAGHAYLTYYVESQDKWVILDWCYYPNYLEVVDRLNYKDEPKYKGVWFSWNEKYAYSTGLNTQAQKMLK